MNEFFSSAIKQLLTKAFAFQFSAVHLVQEKRWHCSRHCALCPIWKWSVWISHRPPHRSSCWKHSIITVNTVRHRTASYWHQFKSANGSFCSAMKSICPIWTAMERNVSFHFCVNWSSTRDSIGPAIKPGSVWNAFNSLALVIHRQVRTAPLVYSRKSLDFMSSIHS